MGVGDIFCFIVNPLYVESPFFCVVVANKSDVTVANKSDVTVANKSDVTVANKSDVTVANKVGWGICRQYVCRQYVWSYLSPIRPCPLHLSIYSEHHCRPSPTNNKKTEIHIMFGTGAKPLLDISGIFRDLRRRVSRKEKDNRTRLFFAKNSRFQAWSHSDHTPRMFFPIFRLFFPWKISFRHANNKRIFCGRARLSVPFKNSPPLGAGGTGGGGGGGMG